MAEHDDINLDHEFATLRNNVFRQVAPAGPLTVRTAVRRHRRRGAVTTGTALALILVAGPVAGYAALNREPAPPPDPAVTVEPTTPPTATPRPSASASATPTPTAPDGRISLQKLLDAPAVDLPDWNDGGRCPTTGARLRKTFHDYPTVLLQHPVGYGDVDRDGAQETVAIVHCIIGQSGPKQVVVFDRDESGRIITLGQVVRSGGDEPVKSISAAVGQPDGSIRVTVGDRGTCCGQDPNLIRWQDRTYSYDGTGFVQTGGPTSFGPAPSNSPSPRPTDLRLVSATDVTFLERPDDLIRRHGSITVTIRNEGPYAADVRIDLHWGTGHSGPVVVMAEGDGWSACSERYPYPPYLNETEATSCGLSLGAGAERTLVLGLVDSRTLSLHGVATAQVRRADGVADPAPGDNQRNFNFG